jgi:hypothetical protein
MQAKLSGMATIMNAFIKMGLRMRFSPPKAVHCGNGLAKCGARNGLEFLPAAGLSHIVAGRIRPVHEDAKWLFALEFSGRAVRKRS